MITTTLTPAQAEFWLTKHAAGSGADYVPEPIDGGVQIAVMVAGLPVGRVGWDDRFEISPDGDKLMAIVGDHRIPVDDWTYPEIGEFIAIH